MNALSILRNIEEAFFRCSVCLNSLPSPMMLSCCHPYCMECLEAVIEASTTALICPLCGTDCDIPDNGFDGFGPEQRVEYTYQSIQIQKSLMQDELGKCAGCEIEKIIVSYCYYCKCFLCSECYQMHLTSKMFLDHRAHIINLKNVSAVKATLEKLVILSEGHRCAKHRHIDQNMICHGCGREPVCSHATVRRIVESRKQEEHHHHNSAPKSTKSGRKSRHKTDRTQPEAHLSDDKEDESILTFEEKVAKHRKELEDTYLEEIAKLNRLKKKDARDKHGEREEEPAAEKLMTSGDGDKHDEIEKDLAAKTEELMNNGDEDKHDEIEKDLVAKTEELMNNGDEDKLDEIEKDLVGKTEELMSNGDGDKHNEIEKDLAAKTEELMANGDGDGDSKMADQEELIHKQVDIGP